MRLLIYADPHWSVSSSIVRSRGEKYSSRLENLIKSLNFVENTAINKGCDSVICLGDFFDTPQLNSEEISALREVEWSDMYHYFLAGNHEMGRGDHTFTSSNIFELCPKSCVITSPTMLPIYDLQDTRIIAIPYILEKDRKPLKEYIDNIKEYVPVDNLIIFSHNDIKDIQMGSFISTEGFTIDEIKENCRLFINGHLHNGCEVEKGIINLGNLTGQNFSENAYRYSHNVMLLDTITHEIELIENPYAFNFYKLDFTIYDESNIKDGDIFRLLSDLKAPAVITVKTNHINDLYVRDLIPKMNNIVESRVIIDMSSSTNNDTLNEPTMQIQKDHFSRFSSYILETLGTSELIKNELSKICREEL